MTRRYERLTRKSTESREAVTLLVEVGVGGGDFCFFIFFKILFLALF